MQDLRAPTLAEDVLLVLFQPDSGSIAGENTLHHVLARAVLADLAFNESLTTTTTRTGSVDLLAVEGQAPLDEIQRSAWALALNNPVGVPTLLAAIGPTLRQPLLERLIARGDIREENGKVLGLLRATTLKDGGSGRRASLIRDIRNVLVEGVEPTPRVAALAALVWGSGTLRQFHPAIPWSSIVISRAQELERGHWTAAGATQALEPGTAAMIGIIAATVFPRDEGPG